MIPLTIDVLGNAAFQAGFSIGLFVVGLVGGLVIAAAIAALAFWLITELLF